MLCYNKSVNVCHFCDCNMINNPKLETISNNPKLENGNLNLKTITRNSKIVIQKLKQ